MADGMTHTESPTESLHPDTEAQIAALTLDATHPLIICDADEVLFQFLIAFENHLECAGWRLQLRKPPSLFGSIFPVGGGEAADNERVFALLEDFYVRRVEALLPIPGAAQALNELARRAQIIVVTNLPPAHQNGRRRAMLVHGMDYPLIVNHGRKGAAVARVLRNHRAPAFFIEDMQVHLASAAAVEGLHCIQLVTHRRLAEVMEIAANAWQARNWHQLRLYIEARLNAGGWSVSGRTSATSGM